MDLHLSSLTLQRKTQETVTLVLSNDFSTKKTFRDKIKTFVSKRTTFYAFAFAFFLLVSPNETAFAHENETKTFIATAYYSPLPNQENYYRWSYEADKKLNGEWKLASDGTPVFVGMIAAPKNYSFGTKIELQGLGVVSVHDRWGAINAGSGYDRIDIWMGYGDEGLKRTLAWGKRELVGKIVHSTTPTSLQLENILQQAPKPLDLALQKLQFLGYNTNNLSTKEVITQFQLDYKIIPSRADEAAGIYGPKTTAKLAEVFKQKQQDSIPTKTQSLEELVVFHDSKNITEIPLNMQTAMLGETTESVKNLQNFLAKKGYYTHEIHGKMTIETLGALRKYQFINKIPQTGRIDAATEQIIKRDLEK